MSLTARRCLAPRIACLATGLVLTVPVIAGSPLLPGSADLNAVAPNALHHARIALTGEIERTLRVLTPLTSDVDSAPTNVISGVGAGGAQHLFGGSIASVNGGAPHVAPGRPTSLASAVMGATRLDPAAVEGFSAAALRVAAASSNPIQDLQVIGGVLASLVQNVVDSLGTTPQAVQQALQALGKGNVNLAFSTLEGLIITPLAFFAIGPGPQQIADALTNLFPPGAPVFQVLPSVTTNVGIGLIDVYTSTRQTIVDAVTSSINSVGTLNPLFVAKTLAAGLSAVSARLFGAVFGPTGIIATLVDAGQQIVNALAPTPAVPADPTSLPTTTTGSAAEVAAAPTPTEDSDAAKDTASKPHTARVDAPVTGASSTTSENATSTAASTNLTNSSTRDGSTAAGSSETANVAETTGSTKAPAKGAGTQEVSPPLASGTAGTSSTAGHGASQSSGSAAAGASSTVDAAQHESPSISDHGWKGTGSHRPRDAASGTVGTAQPAHGATHSSAGGADSATSNGDGAD